MDLCIYNEILDLILITDKKLLHFKLSKSGQILRVDKTCFPRPGHISNTLPKVSKVDHMINYNYENSTQYNLPVQLVHNSTTVPTYTIT